MKFIFLILIFIKTLNAYDLLILNSFAEKSNIYKKQLKFIQKIEQDRNKEDYVIYLFVSNSIPKTLLRDFIIEASVLNYMYHVKVAMVTQGFYKKEYIEKLREIHNEFDSYVNSKIFQSNMKNFVDPYIFKKMKITQVPAIAFGTFKNSNYPSDANIKYIARGAISVYTFFKKISKEEEEYEKFCNIIYDFLH